MRVGSDGGLMFRKLPLVIIDLRLIEWVERKESPALIEKEHQRLHQEQKSHIHLDGSLHKMGG